VLNMMEDSEDANRQLKQAQEELKKAMEELKKIDVKKDEFISITAHEFKTPLTAIRGFAELLSSGKVDEKSRQKYLRIMMEETKRLAKLVTEILDLSRIDLGTFKFNFEEIDVRRIVEDVKSEMKETITEKGLKAEYYVSENVPKTIVTDTERLRQVLINLLTNAVKYTPKGRIWLNVFREGNSLHFAVKDTGIGISKEHIPKLFQRFYQIDSSYTRAQKGSGLGLAICKEILEAMGGKIWLESEVGKGSTFHFTIPLKQDINTKNKN
ncbi:MAG: HAMP domain-containing sensor histidine kinase, partial [Candidatus Aenigmatarchaeota archaeon]